jgi:aryl-alcohol dehydrogenase-like predicted oxidoreductase
MLPIPGTGSPAHAAENVAAAALELSPDELEAIGKGGDRSAGLVRRGRDVIRRGTAALRALRT